MCKKKLLVLLTVYIVLSITNGQKEKKFFRKDYHYIDSMQSFYKVHTLHKTWRGAKKMCALEGAQLFYPENNNESQVVGAFWRETQPFKEVYVGISDLVAKGVFETIDGIPVGNVYNKWSPGEPNDTDGNEDCVVMQRDSTYNDVPCILKIPFICKKTLASLEWNQECDIPNLDYKFNEKLGRCYKFHVKLMNWTEAHAVCSAEQAYLAIINSKEEADFLAAATESLPKNKGNLMAAKFLLLGFHDRHDDGWETVRGTSLEDSGYMSWAEGQPDGPQRGVEERCGAMAANGLLNDIPCAQKGVFACEHELNKIASSVAVHDGDNAR